MKPFDLEAVKRGEPVCTRDFRPVEIIYVYDSPRFDKPITSVMSTKYISKRTLTHYLDGSYDKTKEDAFDLFMADSAALAAYKTDLGRTPDKYEELEQVVKPLIRWLNEHGNLHTKVIVDTTSVEVVSGDYMFKPKEERD